MSNNQDKIKNDWIIELKNWYQIPLNEDVDWPKISKIQLTYYIPFGLPFSNGQGIVKTDADTIQVEVEIKQKPPISSKDGDKIPIPAMGMSESMRMWNDRFGKYNYTALKFTFKIEPNLSIIELPTPTILEKSVMAANRILDSCRMVSDRYCPRNLIKADIDGYNIIYYDSEGKSVHATGSFIGQGKQVSNELFTQEQLNKFDFILKNNIKMTLEQELVLNAQDYLLFENYRMACIEIQSAVEAVISKILEERLAKNGKSDEEIAEVLRKRLDDLKPYLKELSPKIIDSTEWQNWKVQCYDIRNKVIHRRYTPNHNEAENAIKTGKSIIDLLNTLS